MQRRSCGWPPRSRLQSRGCGSGSCSTHERAHDARARHGARTTCRRCCDHGPSLERRRMDSRRPGRDRRRRALPESPGAGCAPRRRQVPPLLRDRRLVRRRRPGGIPSQCDRHLRSPRLRRALSRAAAHQSLRVHDVPRQLERSSLESRMHRESREIREPGFLLDLPDLPVNSDGGLKRAAEKNGHMAYTLSEWINLLLRWAHVFAAILWVGTTYFFTWLDGQFSRRDDVWLVHSGGFYIVKKEKLVAGVAGRLHWFRWEAAFTWISGVVL